MENELKTFYVRYGRRKSIREFAETEIEEDKLERLLNVLRRAQSAANRQPWHFILVKGSTAGEFKDIFTREGFKAAPLYIVACAEPKRAWQRKADNVNYAWVDVTIAVTEMLGAATAEGIGSCWVAAIDPAEVKRILGIPGDIEIVGVIVMGYPVEELKWEEKDRKPLEEIVHHEKW